jgi:hypothetical protein
MIVQCRQFKRRRLILRKTKTAIKEVVTVAIGEKDSGSKRRKAFYVNADNKELLPDLFAGPDGVVAAVLGHVDEVNGQGAEEVPDFVPTRHELIELAKYWAREELEIKWSLFLYGSLCTSEALVGSFTCRRMDRIAAVLGVDEFDQAIDEVYVRFQAEHNQTLWDIFRNGDESQWREVQEQVWRDVDGMPTARHKAVPAKVQVTAKGQARQRRVPKPHDRAVIPTSIRSQKDVTGVGDCEL